VLQDIDFVAEDEQATLEVIEGTIVLTEDEEPLEQVQMAPYEGNLPELPEGTYLIAGPYDFSPDGAQFDPAIELMIRYDPETIPEGVIEEEIRLAYYDAIENEWVDLPSVVHTGALKVTADASHFTIFAVLGTEPAPGLNTWVVVGPIIFVAFVLLFALALTRYY
jgi:hypothetical protein